MHLLSCTEFCPSDEGGSQGATCDSNPDARRIGRCSVQVDPRRPPSPSALLPAAAASVDQGPSGYPSKARSTVREVEEGCQRLGLGLAYLSGSWRLGLMADDAELASGEPAVPSIDHLPSGIKGFRPQHAPARRGSACSGRRARSTRVTSRRRSRKSLPPLPEFQRERPTGPGDIDRTLHVWTQLRRPAASALETWLERHPVLRERLAGRRRALATRTGRP